MTSYGPRVRRGLLAALVLVLLGATAVWARPGPPELRAAGPVTVSGTEASGTFTMGSRVVRQVRYADRGTLHYSFRLVNDGRRDVTVNGVRTVGSEATLLRLRGLRSAEGSERVEIPAGGSSEVVLDVLMTDCERLSARASSLVTDIAVQVAAWSGSHVVEVALPEQLRTGSAREMHCPRATADTRPPG